MRTEGIYEATNTYDLLNPTDFSNLPPNLTSASPQRKAEFFFGRQLAQNLFSQMKLPGVWLQADQQGVPIWPKNFVGSLSHTVLEGQHLKLWVAVAPKSHLKSLGIDIQRYFSFEEFELLKNEVFNTNELTLLYSSPYPPEKILTLSYSVKESLFKMIFPLRRAFFDFSEVEIISICHETNRIEFQFSSQNLPSPPPVSLGAFEMGPGWVRTMVFQPRLSKENERMSYNHMK